MTNSQVNALVMSGGGARGAFELGVVDYLILDKQLDFKVITGVSAGALNAAMLAQGEGYEGLRDVLEELKQVYFSIKSNGDVFLKRGPAGVIDLPTDLDDLLGAVGSNAIYDFKPLHDKIQRHVRPDRLAAADDKKLRVGVVSLKSGEYKSVKKEEDDIQEYVLASASIPFFFPPVEIKGEQYVDGGVRNVTPLKDAFEALKELDIGEDEPRIFVVLSTPLEMQELKGPTEDVIAILKRTTDIMVSEIYRNDLEYAKQINSWLTTVQQMGWKQAKLKQLGLEGLKDKIYADIIVFEPEESYIDPLDFDKEKIKQAFDAGRKTAARTLAGQVV